MMRGFSRMDNDGGRKRIAFFLSFLFLVFLSLPVSAADSPYPVPASDEVLQKVPDPFPKQKEELSAPQSGGIYVRPDTQGSDPFKAGTQVDFSTFRKWAGHQSKVDIPTTSIARTDKEWERLWLNLIGESPPTSTMPPKVMAVAIFLGKRPSEFYSVRMTGLRQDSTDDSLYITYAEIRPRIQREKRSDEVNAVTTPWVIYFVPAADGQIRFKKEIRTK